MGKLFLTGITGFIGERLAQRASEAGHQLTGLSRSAINATSQPNARQVVQGDLLEPDSYRDALIQADTILHLAAATGRATPAEHFRVNREGTRRLLEACREAGVRRLIFVSTIAVTYPDKKRYYYAQAKQQAEELVRESGVMYTIVRPTIVVGPDSPVLEGLRKLAELPIVPIFGNGRARVQPIYLDDLVDFLLEIANDERFNGETLELGGPEIGSISDFLGEIHRQQRDSEPRSLHIPLPPLLPVLAALETVAYRLLPVTVGQLAVFRFDGTARSNALYESQRSGLRSIREMLELSLS